MIPKWTFETALNFWRLHRNGDAEPVWNLFVSAEAYILDRAPKTKAEAEAILEVLLDQGPDGRADGRDRKALRRLRVYIRALPTPLAAAA